jgi:hypothetical protein
MSLLLSLKDEKMFEAIIVIDEIHNSTLQLLRKYAERRVALTEQMPAKFEGEKGTIMMTSDQTQAIMPLMVEVETLAKAVVARTKQDSEEAARILVELQSLLRAKTDYRARFVEKPTEPVRVA